MNVNDANGSKLKVGDVVQIDPQHDERFGGCFMLITKLKQWGTLGFVQIPGNSGGQAFYRCPTKAGVLIGQAEWVTQDEEHERAGDGG